jgi:ferredoxin
MFLEREVGRAVAKVVVDRETCITSGMCTSVAPEIFQLDDEGKLQILLERPPPELVDKAKDAVLCCPVEAISVED